MGFALGPRPGFLWREPGRSGRRLSALTGPWSTCTRGPPRDSWRSAGVSNCGGKWHSGWWWREPGRVFCHRWRLRRLRSLRDSWRHDFQKLRELITNEFAELSLADIAAGLGFLLPANSAGDISFAVVLYSTACTRLRLALFGSPLALLFGFKVLAILFWKKLPRKSAGA